MRANKEQTKLKKERMCQEGGERDVMRKKRKREMERENGERYSDAQEKQTLSKITLREGTQWFSILLRDAE